ncbi:molybdate ABC transporter substrate-binding protein [Maricaulis sp.]|uniref:molybdate ABC transporter substrate-binding protein n=1 Tax=Maricaulis sp. TaxID=1486257 RepID=UPI002633A4B5|nr:molybdate ABC transporter substrate-binding protein [Maricaulis sp.]
MRDGLIVFLLSGLLAVTASASARADEIRVAVAANFLSTARQLEAAFEAEHDHQVTLIPGSTGLLYAQIVQGAPFDILLAADQARPSALAARGLGLEDTRFTYATGQLSLLFQPGDAVPADLRGILQQASRIAMAQPELAPYGLAAGQVLDALGLSEKTADNQVYGVNVAQVYAVVATGNADAGFIARSALVQSPVPDGLKTIDIPASLHRPVHQDAIRLARGRSPAAAQAFLDYLRSPSARALMQQAGYESHAP